MVLKRTHGVFGRLALVAVVAASGPSVAFAQEAPPIVNGSPTGNFESVGAILACDAGNCYQYCSATLVNQEWIVTAAHCIEAADEYDRYGYENYFGVGNRVNSLSDYDLMVEWAMNPDYHGSSSDLSHDIGVARLETGITSVEPTPINQERVTHLWVGDDLTYVGFGITGDNRYDSGTKRFAEMPVYQFDSYIIYALDLADGQNLCSGDSGGAALEPVGDGYELAGVNSFVFGYEYSDKSCEGGGNGVVRLDAHLDFLQEYFDVDTTGGGGDPGDGGSAGDGGGSGDGGDLGDGGAADGGSDDSDTPARPTDATPESDGFGSCSAAPAPVGLGFVLLGLAAVGLRRRRDDD